jgi:hypothetical protein
MNLRIGDQHRNPAPSDPVFEDAQYTATQIQNSEGRRQNENRNAKPLPAWRLLTSDFCLLTSGGGEAVREEFQGCCGKSMHVGDPVAAARLERHRAFGRPADR